jgi:6-pyruvoyltetrahydropterin/6-carboxytetrahydropterin synthase
MHSLMLTTEFCAQHFLIGKDFGEENFKHSHRYKFEIEIKSKHLDEFNFIIDIVQLKQDLDTIVAHFDNKTLNELPEFSNQNPSLELFSKILWQKCNGQFNLPEDGHIIVRLWEDNIAQATYLEVSQ